ncbi:MAG: hypothetical protein UT33_C0005G0106 [Candidatus Peregrinibacteria bacterium GW2011_GWC2_39_14]|nr:MAG: hypothetical protein US92_C0001G0106 [Candidatus Peregrinibacteria bacterium GW2011_GWA2_38_36]KKR07162.1 MAG: hypothetical protein UT33_C0005G0106 [Candidatus Peregrinibacteria bacterium GW2011_GWC2_39_14]
MGRKNHRNAPAPKEGAKSPRTRADVRKNAEDHRIRNVLLLIGAVIGSTALGVMFKGSNDATFDNTTSPAVTATTNGNSATHPAASGPNLPPDFDEAKLDILIAKIENAMTAFKAQLNFDKIKHPNMKPGILRLFDLIGNNAKNDLKNYGKYKRAEASTKDLSATRVTTRPYDFSYLVDDSTLDSLKFVAAYSHFPRHMILSSDFNPNSPMDLLAMLHEATHLGTDADFVLDTRNDPETLRAYLHFYTHEPGEKKKCDVVDEAKAWAVQTELLNVFLDGDLEKLANSMSVRQIMDRGESHRYEDILKKLKIENEEEIYSFMGLLLSAKYYFAGPNHDNEFIDIIAYIHEKLGARLFVMDKNKRFVPYKRKPVVELE